MSASDSGRAVHRCHDGTHRVSFDAMASRRKVDLAEQLEAAVASARTLLEAKSMATGAQLGAAAVRPQVVQRLCGEGYEPTSKGVRVALAVQFGKLSAQGRPIPVADLKKRLKGASAKDLQEFVAELRRTSKVKLVLRGKQPCLVSTSEHVVEPRALETIAKKLKATVLWLEKARKDKLALSVLDADLAAELDTVKSLLGKGRSKEAEPLVPLPVALRGAILALRDEDSRLASIPEVSRRLRERATSNEVIEVLLSEFRRGALELRPEGGLGRLSAEDAALCPRGAGGVPLSWVLLLEE